MAPSWAEPPYTVLGAVVGAALSGAAVGYFVGREQERLRAKDAEVKIFGGAKPSKGALCSSDAQLYNAAEADSDSAVRIRFVHINDVYSLQNLPQLRGLVQSVSEEIPAGNVVVTIGGDLLSPYPLAALDKGRGMVDVLLQCGVRYACLGNHEADVGMPALRARIEEWRSGGGVFLNTNIPDLLPDLGLPTFSRIVAFSRDNKCARRIGLLGVCTTDPGLYTPPADFGGALATAEECNESAYATAKRLMTEITTGEGEEEKDEEQEQVDAVVVLTHQDTEDDRKLAIKGRDVGIPLILGGHDHGECMEEWNGCALAKAGSDAHRAVVVDLVWPTPETTEPIVTMDFLGVDGYSRSWPVVQTCEKHMAKVHQLERLSGAVALVHFDANQPMMSSAKIRLKQTTMGTFLCTGLRDELEADCCLFDSGNIRGNKDYVEAETQKAINSFTLADLETELPWPSELTIITLLGSEVRDAIRWSRGHLPTEFGGFLQVDDGIIVQEDNQAEVTHVAGEPLDADRSYRVGIIHDSLTGMNGHPVFSALRKRLGKQIQPLDACRPSKILLLSQFARQAWTQMPSFENMDSAGKGFLTKQEVKAGYLVASAGRRPSVISSEADAQRGTDVFVGQMLSVSGNNGDKISREEYEQIFGSRLPRCRTPSPNRLDRSRTAP